MKPPKRAIRRHHYQRLKRKRKNYWYRNLSDRHLGIVVNTPRVCSCPLCGNPRRHWNEMTVQERREFEQ
jgi:hypothetical protein